MLYTWVTMDDSCETECFTSELPRINGAKRNAIHMMYGVKQTALL